ncbi:hypothetical protein DFP73DRAFT_269522 [Morchella snyderi]|nr:hypothetical protein DFP73DRAFT_269522 [Morchella snyderi]
MRKYFMSKLSRPNRRRKKDVIQESAPLPGPPASKAEGHGGVSRLENAPSQAPTASWSAHAIAINPSMIASSSVSGKSTPEVKPEPAAPTATFTPKISAETDSRVSTLNSGGLGTSAGVLTGPLNLWKIAINKLDGETRKYIAEPENDIDLVKALIEEITQKKKECNAKRWFYTNSKGENVFYVEALVGQLNKYAQIGDVALQHHPDIVALAWSGFRFLLQVGTAYTGDMRTVSESVEHIVRILFCCDIYERLYCETSLRAVMHLVTSLVELYVSILEYLCYAKKYLSGNTGSGPCAPKLLFGTEESPEYYPREGKTSVGKCRHDRERSFRNRKKPYVIPIIALV